MSAHTEPPFVAARREFMAAAGEPMPTSPTWRPEALQLWQTMLAEEIAELNEAAAACREPGVVDEAERVRRLAELAAEGCDVINVVVGLLLSQGLPIWPMFDAIHAANMAKMVDGRAIRRADGKILKPEGWQPADKSGVIRAAIDAAQPGH